MAADKPTYMMPEGDDPWAKPAIQRLNLGPMAQFPSYIFRRAFSKMGDSYMKAVEGFGLRRVDIAVLMLLKYNPGTAPSDLADELDVARTNFVGIVTALRSRGLVVRQSRPDDRRYFALYLTPEGLAMVNKIEPRLQAHEENLRRQLEQNNPDLIEAVHTWTTRNYE